MSSIPTNGCRPATSTCQEGARLICFYLPQFHPIAENDEWWGKGFTEWTNVTKSGPRFAGHHQPHLPSDLGYYDLRLPEVRTAQAELAREYGVHGFCYYHYWFNGRRLLERPFEEVLATGEPDFPFCLCWANENWTRIWDGEEREVLLRQDYSKEDDLRHIRSLLPALADRRAIRVSGRPLLLIYRIRNLPEPRATAELWNDVVERELGVRPMLCAVQADGPWRPASDFGFDAIVEFQPRMDLAQKYVRAEFHNRILNKLGLSRSAFHRDRVFDHRDLVARSMAEPDPHFLRFPGVTPSWDNSARRERGAFILTNSTPELYGRWLRDRVERATRLPEGQRLVFINAWNEWAEGNHLEPDRRYGRAWLEQTRDALRSASAGPVRAVR